MAYTIGFLGIIGLVVGIFAAAVADVFPTYRTPLQGWGGGLLVGSAVFIGFAFPMI
jgi:hypothetical protein